MNQVFLTGRVTRDCHVNTLQSGATIINFSVAVEDKFKKADGTESKRTNFIDCVRFTRHPDGYVAMLTKGAPVLVIGAIQQDTWDDKKTGQKRSAVKVKAEQVLPVYAGQSAPQAQPPLPKNEPSPDPQDGQATDNDDGANLPF